MATKIYSRFKPPAKPGLTGFSPTRTQQHFKDETDINKIIQRAITTGDTTVFTTTQRAQYYDVSAFEDYQAALDRVSDVEADFFSLPSKLRKEFDNDPERYVEFMADPSNVARAIELGLLEGSGESLDRRESQSPGAKETEPEQPPAGSNQPPAA